MIYWQPEAIQWAGPVVMFCVIRSPIMAAVVCSVPVTATDGLLRARPVTLNVIRQQGRGGPGGCCEGLGVLSGAVDSGQHDTHDPTRRAPPDAAASNATAAKQQRCGHLTGPEAAGAGPGTR